MKYTVYLLRKDRIADADKSPDVAVCHVEADSSWSKERQAQNAYKAAILFVLELDNFALEDGRDVRTEMDYTCLCVVSGWAEPIALGWQVKTN